MKWTEQLPTEEAHYWMRYGKYNPYPNICMVRKIRGVLGIINDNNTLSFLGELKHNQASIEFSDQPIPEPEE